MKKSGFFSVIFVLLFTPCTKFASAQISTPKNTPVTCTDYSEGIPPVLVSLRQADSLYIVNHSLNAKIIKGASLRYNCHYYAFYTSETTDTAKHWMLEDNTSLNKFLETELGGDGSYLPANAFPSKADKIIQGTKNYEGSKEWGGAHSMTYSKDPQNEGRDWISKWSTGALVQHGKYDHRYYSPYVMYNGYSYNVSSMVKYGTPSPPYSDITDLVCDRTEQTFNIFMDSHWQLADAYEIGGSKLSNVSVDDNLHIVKFTPVGYGECTLQFVITNGSGLYFNSFSKTFDLGPNPLEPFNALQGPFCMCAGQFYYIYTQVGGFNLDWSFMYGDVQNIYNGCIGVTPYMNQGYVTLTATSNQCPTRTNTSSKFYPSCGGSCPDYYIVNPNPSSEYILVGLTREASDAMAKIEIEKEMLSARDAKITLPDLSNFKYILINKEGNIVLNGCGQQGKVTIDVSSLKQNVYFLIIDYGIGKESHELLIN